MKKLTQIINENYGDDVLRKLSSHHQAAKKDLLLAIGETVGNNDSAKLRDALDILSTDGLESFSVDGLVNENEIYDYYLKHDTDIDEILNTKGFFKKSPSESNIFSLYHIVISGTKEAVKHIAEKLKHDLF